MVDTKEEAYSLAKDIKMSMVTKPALNMLEVFLPDYVTKEFNEYVDGVRESAKSFSHELVGQIKANEFIQCQICPICCLSCSGVKTKFSLW